MDTMETYLPPTGELIRLVADENIIVFFVNTPDDADRAYDLDAWQYLRKISIFQSLVNLC